MKHFIQCIADNKHLSNAQLIDLASNAGYDASRKLRDLVDDPNNPMQQFESIKLSITIEIEVE